MWCSFFFSSRRAVPSGPDLVGRGVHGAGISRPRATRGQRGRELDRLSTSDRRFRGLQRKRAIELLSNQRCLSRFGDSHVSVCLADGTSAASCCDLRARFRSRRSKPLASGAMTHRAAIEMCHDRGRVAKTQPREIVGMDEARAKVECSCTHRTSRAGLPCRTLRHKS
jgi:hypothetical protein